MADDDNIEEQDDQLEDDAEGEDGEGEEGGGEGGGKKKLLLIIVVAVLLIGGAGGGAFFILSNTEEEPAPEAAEEAPKQQAYFYKMPEFVINIGTRGVSNKFLKLKVHLELASEEDAKIVEQVLPRIVDDFNLYLRQLRVEDLQGSAGIFRLKEALLLRAKQSAKPADVKNVLFTEVLVQ